MQMKMRDVGPIVGEFTLDLPDEGGLCILKGPAGCGKTTVLHHAELLVTGNGQANKRDGAPEAVVEGFGRRLKVRKKVVTSGELEIEGASIDLGDLHAPKLKDAALRDRTRIKTLLRVAGAEAAPELFRGVLESTDLDPEDVVLDADLVEAAAAIKRKLEKLAREHEAQAEKTSLLIQTNLEAIKDVPLDAPSDREQLQATVEEAVGTVKFLTERQRADEERRAASDRAAKALEQARANYTGPSVADAQQALEKTRRLHTEADSRVRELQEALAEAEREHEKAHLAWVDADNRLAEAKRHEQVLAAWQETVQEGGDAVPVTSEQIAEAEEQLQRAREALEMGVRVRQAQAAKRAIADLKSARKSQEERAQAYRLAAGQCETVLSNAVGQIPGCPLRVWMDADGNPRVVCTHKRNGERTLFDELSDGERWALIVPLAMGPRRFLKLESWHFNEIQPKNRALLHELAREHGCIILTAQVTDDEEMRVDVFQ